MNYECLICQVKSLQERLEKFEIAESERDCVVRELMIKIAAIDLEKSYSPEITRDIIERLKDFSTVTDAYQKEKDQSNREFLSRYDELKELVRSSDNPFDTAMRLAIAGNIIDFGPTSHFDVEGNFRKVLDGKLAIDHSQAVKSRNRKS
jgi:uncharacterized protein with ATP-grasp and redox domains